MRKYLVLILSLFLVTGCGSKKEGEEEYYVDHEYEINYINAVTHLKKLSTYEYTMEVESNNKVTSTVKYNKQGEFGEITETLIDGASVSNVKYWDTQKKRYVEYDTKCGRGWTYTDLNLTNDMKYGPYIQFLSSVPSERITKKEGDTYFIEADYQDVEEAITNNQMTYNGKIKMEVNLDKNDRFKHAIITFEGIDVKSVTIDFVAYSNVEVMMSQEAQNAIKYLDNNC